jgi:hypothetical protein
VVVVVVVGADPQAGLRPVAPRLAEHQEQPLLGLLQVQVRQERALRQLTVLPDRAMSEASTTPSTIRAAQATPQRPPIHLALIRRGRQILRDRHLVPVQPRRARQRSEQRKILLAERREAA